MSGMEGMLLFITSRIAEFVGIILTIFLLFRGYRAKYVYLIGGIIIMSIILSLLSLVFKEYFLPIAIGDIVITLLLLGAILLYVVKNPEKTRDFTPPEDARCFYCNALIQKEDNLCLIRIGGATLYFDSFEHFLKFLREYDYFMREKGLPRGRVEDMFVKTYDTGEWRKVERVSVGKRGEELVALSDGGSSGELEKLIENFRKAVNPHSAGGT